MNSIDHEELRISSIYAERSNIWRKMIVGAGITGFVFAECEQIISHVELPSYSG